MLCDTSYFIDLFCPLIYLSFSDGYKLISLLYKVTRIDKNGCGSKCLQETYFTARNKMTGQRNPVMFALFENKSEMVIF